MPCSRSEELFQLHSSTAISVIPRFFNCRNDSDISHNFTPLAVLHRELGKAAMIHLNSTSSSEYVKEWVRAMSCGLMLCEQLMSFISGMLIEPFEFRYELFA